MLAYDYMGLYAYNVLAAKRTLTPSKIVQSKHQKNMQISIWKKGSMPSFEKFLFKM
jgi:hypothetical protein